MTRPLPIRAVQFVSRACIPERLSEDFYSTDARLPFRVTMTVVKGKVDVRDGEQLNAPSAAPPWPDAGPSIGAYEFVDPYFSQRWPEFVEASGELELPDNYVLMPDSLADCSSDVRGLLWGAFIAACKHLWHGRPACKLSCRPLDVLHDRTDIDGNPRPTPRGEYCRTDLGMPVGPGFATVDGVFATRELAIKHDDLRLEPSSAHPPGRGTVDAETRCPGNKATLELMPRGGGRREIA